MPIRMEKDSNNEHHDRSNNNDEQQRKGGNGMLMKFLPFIAMFVLKNPRLLMPALLIGGFLYFTGGLDMFLNNSQPQSQFGFGMDMKQEVYDLAEVFEPLAAGSSKNNRPPSASLLKYCPPRLNQGMQGSCVGWASAYSARTILHARATGEKPRDIAFSPAYLYNQIALRGCQGSYMHEALKTMKQRGAVPFNDFRYDESNCTNQPHSSHHATARNYTIKGYNRLTQGASRYGTDLEAMKQNLAQGAPVVIGMMVGGSFTNNMYGKNVWRPTRRDRSMYGFGGHAMTVIGYDDHKEGGAFQIMNSWGPEWGDNGIAWVSYDNFQHFNREAYGLYPMGNAATEEMAETKLAVRFGLVDNASKRNINLKHVDGNVFTTVNPIAKGDKFKVEVTNSIACYTYVFGEETDGSCYVLFPYTSKHSPYCGITGTRLFPRDYSMKADEIGNTDRIAVVVSKKPLDYDKVKARMNASRKSSYSAKLIEALGPEMLTEVRFQSGETIDFIGDTKGKNSVGLVIEINKN